MADIIRWPVIMACPGEEELPLMADLSARRDAQVVAVADPDGSSLGAGIAEVMGIGLVKDLAEVPRGQAKFLVHGPLDAKVAPLVDLADSVGLEAVSAREFARMIADPAQGPEPAAGTPLRKLDHQLVDEDLFENGVIGHCGLNKLCDGNYACFFGITCRFCKKRICGE